MPIKKIVSGGQTGADIAALDAAIRCGTPHGGWIPQGRLTEDGPLPAQYHLQEMPTSAYPKRTEQNVIDSDGTVIFSHGALSEGSLFTRKMAVQHRRPVIHVDLEKVTSQQAVQVLTDFVEENALEVLNVAGSRGSKDPALYDKVLHIMVHFLIGCRPGMGLS
jgi:predicted Rossmann-fold nucleotide-binding protein